jgi:signal transduction histidine kinase
MSLLYASVFTGQGEAVACWALIALPLYAVYLFGRRASLLWTLVVLSCILGLHVTGQHWPMTADFIATGWKVWMAQTAMVCVTCFFGYGIRQGMDQQVALLAERTYELTEARAQVAESYQRLQELEQTRQDFVEMLVHDMKNPLTGILGYAALLQSDFMDEKEAGRSLERIQVLSERLLTMVSDLLEVSRLEANELSLQLQDVPYRALLQKVIKEFEAPGSSPIVLEDGPETEVKCDPELLGRVMANLLSNARRYSPQDSGIEVFVELEAESLLTRVVDHGIGIAPENQHRIFEKFAQVNSGQVRHSSGLGLTFCKLVVEKHGGSIGVASEQGRGSEFWFRIPLPGFDALQVGGSSRTSTSSL